MKVPGGYRITKTVEHLRDSAFLVFIRADMLYRLLLDLENGLINKKSSSTIFCCSTHEEQTLIRMTNVKAVCENNV